MFPFSLYSLFSGMPDIKGGVIGYNLQHTGKDDDNAKGITSLVGHGESHEVTVSVRPGSKADWLDRKSVV